MPARRKPPATPEPPLPPATAEAELEEGLKETFPASDPVAVVQPGHKTKPPRSRERG